MARYSKTVLASLFFAAAFNFGAQAETAPVVENSYDVIASAEANARALKVQAVQEGLIGADVDPYSVLNVAVRNPKSGVEGLERLLSLETQTQKWSGHDAGIALILAAEKGQSTMVRMLLEKKADVISLEYKEHALGDVAALGDLENVKRLYEAGARINADHDLALFSAAWGGSLPVVKYLMENSAYVFAERDREIDCECNATAALSQAIIQGHMPVVQYMVEEQHMPLNVKDKNGKEYSIALSSAFDSGRADMVEYLYSHGASSKRLIVNSSVEDRDWDMVRLAVSHGVDLADTYRYLEGGGDTQALGLLKSFMVKNHIPLPNVTPANLAPSP